jgi:hypothetical protein
MRFELAGSLIHPDPLVIKYDANADFDTLQHIALGFTHFEVICIGAAGGQGGRIGVPGTMAYISYGGAGGGGGFHRQRGLLLALPEVCSVIVGTAGAIGESHDTSGSFTTDGEDGSYSWFNGNTCMASGGKGGKRVQSIAAPGRTYAHGGDGGVGNRTNPGGGAKGGVAGYTGTGGTGVDGTPGEDGTLVLDIGEGGGGGAGGVGQYPGEQAETYCRASSGGRGSYNPADLSVYGPGSPPGNDDYAAGGFGGPLVADWAVIKEVKPGGASGAKASPLNGLPTVFGQSNGEYLPSANGVVIIRLTAE